MKKVTRVTATTYIVRWGQTEAIINLSKANPTLKVKLISSGKWSSKAIRKEHTA